MTKNAGQSRKPRKATAPKNRNWDTTGLAGAEPPKPELVKRITERLLEFADPATLPPMAFLREEISVDGHIQYANKIKDGLDIMHSNGTISDMDLIAAREFQAAYRVANESRTGCSLKESGSRAPVDAESILHYRMQAGDKVRNMLDVVGGHSNIGALVMISVVGRGMSFNEMVMHHSHPAHFWRGALVGALQALSHYLTKGTKAKG